MSIKITRSKQRGTRSVRLSARFSDDSGHTDILDMLEDYNEKEWSQPEVLHTSLMLLLDAWRSGDTYPLTPSAEYVSKEMLELVKKAKEALTRTNQILELVARGGLSSGDTQSLQNEISQIQGTLDIDIVEGAGAYGSEVSINDNNDEFGEW